MRALSKELKEASLEFLKRCHSSRSKFGQTSGIDATTPVKRLIVPHSNPLFLHIIELCKSLLQVIIEERTLLL